MRRKEYGPTRGHPQLHAARRNRQHLPSDDVERASVGLRNNALIGTVQ